MGKFSRCGSKINKYANGYTSWPQRWKIKYIYRISFISQWERPGKRMCGQLTLPHQNDLRFWISKEKELAETHLLVLKATTSLTCGAFGSSTVLAILYGGQSLRFGFRLPGCSHLTTSQESKQTDGNFIHQRVSSPRSCFSHFLPPSPHQEGWRWDWRKTRGQCHSLSQISDR